MEKKTSCKKTKHRHSTTSTMDTMAIGGYSTDVKIISTVSDLPWVDIKQQLRDVT